MKPRRLTGLATSGLPKRVPFGADRDTTMGRTPHKSPQLDPPCNDRGCHARPQCLDSAAARESSVEQARRGVNAPKHSLLDGLGTEELVHVDVAALGESVRAVGRLLVHRMVPRMLQEHHHGRRAEVHAQASHLRGEQQHVQGVAVLECRHARSACGRRARACGESGLERMAPQCPAAPTYHPRPRTEGVVGACAAVTRCVPVRCGAAQIPAHEGAPRWAHRGWRPPPLTRPRPAAWSPAVRPEPAAPLCSPPTRRSRREATDLLPRNPVQRLSCGWRLRLRRGHR